jgi:hypothetical protein
MPEQLPFFFTLGVVGAINLSMVMDRIVDFYLHVGGGFGQFARQFLIKLAEVINSEVLR